MLILLASSLSVFLGLGPANVSNSHQEQSDGGILCRLPPRGAMALLSGTRLGAYEVLAQIGAGGMGEVYRAHDTKLGRDVAIKVLPEAFAHDPERLSRFQRAAQM